MPLHSSIQAILDNVLDGVIVIDREGIVRGWNAIAERTFGWPAAETIGRELGGLIVPPEHRDGHRAGMARFNASGQAHVLDQRLRMPALCKGGGTIPIELTITQVRSPSGEMFVGFLRDISDLDLAERQARQLALESRLMFELSAMAAESPTLDEALVAALDAICELSGWPLGHAYLVTDDGEGLQSRSWSSGASERAPALVEATRHVKFGLGEGLPGRILKSGKAEWIACTSLDDNFARSGLGFESAFGFPVSSNGKPILVFEFFSTEPTQADDHILKLVQSLGAQVGRVFERRRVEERRQVLMDELAHRTKNLIAVIQGIAAQTFDERQATSKAEALQLFQNRLIAISKAQTVLFGDIQALSLGELIRRSAEGCGVDLARVDIKGPDIALSPTASVMTSLAIHELSTNAFKYGALSVPDGTVSIRWDNCKDEDHRFDLSWEERGGPPVAPPTRSGFGHKILCRAMESETGGAASVEFRREGLVYRLRRAACAAPRSTGLNRRQTFLDRSCRLP